MAATMNGVHLDVKWNKRCAVAGPAQSVASDAFAALSCQLTWEMTHTELSQVARLR